MCLVSHNTIEYRNSDSLADDFSTDIDIKIGSKINSRINKVVIAELNNSKLSLHNVLIACKLYYL